MNLRDGRGHARGAGVRPEVKPGSRVEDVGDHRADDNSQRAEDFEVDQRLGPEPSELPQILDVGQAVDHGAENDGPEQHPEQRDETVAERFHLDRDCRRREAEHHGGGHAIRHLNVELFQEPHGVLLKVDLAIHDLAVERSSSAAAASRRR